MARVYLEEVWNRGYRCGAAGSMLGTFRDRTVVGICDGITLGYVALVVIGDGTTLRYVTVVGTYDCPLGGDVVRVLVGRDVSSITCRFLWPTFFILHYKRGLWLWIVERLRQVLYCFARRISGLKFWYWAVMRENPTVLTILSGHVAGT